MLGAGITILRSSEGELQLLRNAASSPSFLIFRPLTKPSPPSSSAHSPYSSNSAVTMAEGMEGVVTEDEQPKTENVEQKTVAGKSCIFGLVKDKPGVSLPYKFFPLRTCSPKGFQKPSIGEKRLEAMRLDPPRCMPVGSVTDRSSLLCKDSRLTTSHRYQKQLHSPGTSRRPVRFPIYAASPPVNILAPEEAHRSCTLLCHRTDIHAEQFDGADAHRGYRHGGPRDPGNRNSV